MKSKILSIGLLFGLVPGASAVPDDTHFKVETVVGGLQDAMEIAVLPNDDVFIVERTGALKWYSAESGELQEVAKFEVSVRTKDGRSAETGLLGITIDPDFAENGWIYVYYSPKEPEEHRLARFTFKDGKIADEKILLTMAQSRKEGVCHEGGSLAFDREGNLFLSTGDNSAPGAAKGYPPLDEREGHEHVNAQRSSGDTNDLRGKILRIRPTDDGSYEIPEGNLFPEGTEGTRPEIFVMGCRNPWRIGVDQRTGTVYWGEVGPDARKETSRGPRGYDEINQAATAGNYGWPYFVADNKAYSEWDFATEKAGKKFDAEKPVNDSRLNTGLRNLPPARAPLWFEYRSCYCAGPVFYQDDHGGAESKLPKEMDGCLITYDWNTGRFQLTKLKDGKEMEWKVDWLSSVRFTHPSDVALGRDGTVYVLEYGSGWRNNKNGKLRKVTYSATALADKGAEEADPRLEGLDMKHPGTALLAEATCLSCHSTQTQSLGPCYADVADRYRGKEGAEQTLIKKVMAGGSGAWGDVPMPPSPQYNEEQISQMIDAILSLESGGHKE